MAETLKLYKPITVDGNEMKELEYDFDNITGVAMESAKKMLIQNGIVSNNMSEMDSSFHAAVFSIAAGIDYNDMQRLHGRDYMKAANLVRNFFFLNAEESQE